MKLMKFMPAALLLCFSLGAFAQDEDLTEEVAGEEEVEDVFVPKTPIEKKFFQRVQLGFMGTNVKYTNFGLSPDYNNYFLKGIGFGWMGDFKIAKKYPIYFEIGAMFTYHTGRSKGDSIYTYHNEPGSSGEGEYTKRHYRIQAFSVTVPVSVSYQFRNAFNVEDLTLAPYAGLYFRFNAVCNRWETTYTTDYLNGRRSPFGDSSLTGTVKGLRLSTTAPELFRANQGCWARPLQVRIHPEPLLPRLLL